MPLHCITFPDRVNAPSEPDPGAFNHCELNFILGSVPVKSIRFCAGRGAAEHDYGYQSLALGDHRICSDRTGALQRPARKTEAVATLTWNIKMAPMFGAAKYQAYRTCPKAVKLLLRVQKY